MAELAATGHPDGLFRAALKLANGMGVAKDFDTSITYMRTAAALGHEKAVSIVHSLHCCVIRSTLFVICRCNDNDDYQTQRLLEYEANAGVTNNEL